MVKTCRQGAYVVHVRDPFVNFRFVEQVEIRQLFFNDFFRFYISSV